MRFTERDVHGAQMFTALHRPQSEYDAPAPFAMPSYASVMGDFNHVRFHPPVPQCAPCVCRVRGFGVLLPQEERLAGAADLLAVSSSSCPSIPGMLADGDVRHTCAVCLHLRVQGPRHLLVNGVSPS